jgi:hypothetical protein
MLIREDNCNIKDCETALLLALGWVFENLHEFSVPTFEANTFDKDDFVKIKPISELSLTLSILKRNKIIIPVVDPMLEWIWQQTNDGKLLLRLLLARNDFLPGSALYSPLYQMDYKSEVLDSLLEMFSKSTLPVSLPLQPWAQLALNYNLRKLGQVVSPFDRSRLYISNLPEPWVVSNEVAYAITHEVFYLTDFGFNGIDCERTSEYLNIWLPYWFKKFLLEKDCDLVGEFAMVWCCIYSSQKKEEEIPNPIYSILKYQNTDGSIDGPKGAGQFLQSEGNSKERKDFLAKYHTTLVYIMALAMTLNDSRQNPLNKQSLLSAKH